MRSFTLSLVSFVLLIFVVGCSKNTNQNLQSQKNSSAVEKSTTADNCVTYDFSDLVSGQQYDFWNGLTFFNASTGAPYTVWGDNYAVDFASSIHFLIKFPTTDAYYKLSYDIECSCDKGLDVTVYGTNGYKSTVSYDNHNRATYSFTAPNGVYLTAIEFYPDDNHLFNLYSLELCKVDFSCTAPEVNSLKASPSELWPANNKETEVTFTGKVENNCGSTTYQLTDEYGAYSYTGTIASGDYFSIPLELMASRKGNDKDGRTYNFIVTSENAAGTVVDTVSVVVPHDQRKK